MKVFRMLEMNHLCDDCSHSDIYNAYVGQQPGAPTVRKGSNPITVFTPRAGALMTDCTIQGKSDMTKKTYLYCGGLHKPDQVIFFRQKNKLLNNLKPIPASQKHGCTIGQSRSRYLDRIYRYRHNR